MGEGAQKSKAFKEVEELFKNEVRRSRSLVFCSIFKAYMAKYNFLMYYPCKDRIADRYDLVKPKGTFFNFLALIAFCIVWMMSICFSSILDTLSSDVTTVSNTVYYALIAGVAVVSSPIIMVCIGRLYRLYVINMKKAFLE